MLRFRPHQRGLKGVEGVEKAVGRWQRDLIDKILCRCYRAPIEGGNPPREPVDEIIQLRVGKCAVDLSISFRGFAVEVICAENDFKRTTTADRDCITKTKGRQSHVL